MTMSSFSNNGNRVPDFLNLLRSSRVKGSRMKRGQTTLLTKFWRERQRTKFKCLLHGFLVALVRAKLNWNLIALQLPSSKQLSSCEIPPYIRIFLCGAKTSANKGCNLPSAWNVEKRPSDKTHKEKNGPLFILYS